MNLYWNDQGTGIYSVGTLWDRIEERALARLFPVLTETGVCCPAKPVLHHPMCSGAIDYRLMDMVGHLNDVHHWPRTERDRSSKNQNLPTIVGWLKEEAEKNGWDLTCTSPK